VKGEGFECEWVDLQFSYALSIDRSHLRYSKKLLLGGHLPTGPVDLATSVLRKNAGAPQEGEEGVSVALREIRSASLRKRPYHGYSAFRTPVIIFSGIGAAVAVMLWKAPEPPWTLLDWALAIGSLVITSSLVAFCLARIFRRQALVLECPGVVEIDVHSMPEDQKAKALRLLEGIRSAGP
jgi:hypothetical protein